MQEQYSVTHAHTHTSCAALRRQTARGAQIHLDVINSSPPHHTAAAAAGALLRRAEMAAFGSHRSEPPASMRRAYSTYHYRFRRDYNQRSRLYFPRVGLCESSFLLLEYFAVYLIQYSILISEAINYRVVQNKRRLGFSLQVAVQKRCEVSH